MVLCVSISLSIKIMKNISRALFIWALVWVSLIPSHASNNMTFEQVRTQITNVQQANNTQERGFIWNIIANIFNTSGRITAPFIDSFVWLTNMNIPYWNNGNFVPWALNQTAWTNGRVGIGTNPHATARLNVDWNIIANNIFSSSNDWVKVLWWGVSQSQWASIALFGSEHITFPNTLTFRTSNLNRFMINEDGNIWIWINNPLQRLHVAWNIQATGKIFAQSPVESDPSSTVITKEYLNTILDNYDFDDIGWEAPIGSVMAFNRDTCPPGWITADGQNDTPDLRGEFIRGLDLGRWVDPGRTLGGSQLDAMQPIRWEFNASQLSRQWGNNRRAIGAFGVWSPIIGAMRATRDGRRSQEGFNIDSSRVTRTANETRPRNVALLYCQKIANVETTPAENFTWMNTSWDDTGNVVLATSGNVGIWTNTPGERLHVSGKILAQTPTASDWPNTVTTKAYIESNAVMRQSIPTCNQNNQALWWDGDNLICNTIEGWNGWGTSLDLVNELHSSNQCENLGGEVVTDSEDNKFCRFEANSCPEGWFQYENWQTLGPTLCSGHCRSCTTPTSGWVNSTTWPTCVYKNRFQHLIGWPRCYRDYGDVTCTAQTTEIWCY